MKVHRRKAKPKSRNFGIRGPRRCSVCDQLGHDRRAHKKKSDGYYAPAKTQRKKRVTKKRRVLARRR